MLKMKIVVISDSFKGSLSSGEIVDIFNNVKDEYYKEIKIKYNTIKYIKNKLNLLIWTPIYYIIYIIK